MSAYDSKGTDDSCVLFLWIANTLRARFFLPNHTFLRKRKVCLDYAIVMHVYDVLPLSLRLHSTQTHCVHVSFCPTIRFCASAKYVWAKRNTLTSEGVCVGRSYRNRTYTVGVRGPSATTTPSSIACVIIYQCSTFCNRFCQS